ncbi:hypothetical protein GOP47_0027962 [Adiantum capillus-veneris]|nr:hypothetical protein GOP47_0027962 [Adiantum capillus-veneris]
MEVVVSPSTFTLIRGAPQSHQCGEDDGEDACIYNHNEESFYVSGGAVVPFSWEKKPRVPLIVDSKYNNSNHMEAMKGKKTREGELEPQNTEEGLHMSNAKRSSACESKEEAKAHVLTPFKHGTNVLLRSDEDKSLACTTPLKQFGSHSMFSMFPRSDEDTSLVSMFSKSDEDKSLVALPPLKQYGSSMLLKRDEEKALALAPLKHGSKLFRSDHEEKALALSQHMLFPLPPPPNSSLQNKLTHDVGVLSSTTTATTASDYSNPSTPSTHINSRAIVHTKKHRGSSFPPFLNVSKPSSSSHTCVVKANNDLNLKDDPFLRAIQACTQTSKMGDYIEDKNLVGSAKNSSKTSNGGSNAKNSSATSHGGRTTKNDIGRAISTGNEVQYSKHKSLDYTVQRPAMAKDSDINSAATKGVAEDAGKTTVRGSCGTIKAPMIRTMMEKEVSCSTKYGDGGSMKAKLYEGHSAFMVASFQQQSAALNKQKKTPRSAGYGACLSCRSADSNDSIVRIYHPRSSFS